MTDCKDEMKCKGKGERERERGRGEGTNKEILERQMCNNDHHQIKKTPFMTSMCIDIVLLLSKSFLTQIKRSFIFSAY